MTTFQIERETLLKPLLAVAGVVERRHTLAILSNVLIQVQPEQVSLVATDLEMEIRASEPYAAQTEAAFTVAAKKLLDILRAVPESSLLQMQLHEQRLDMRAGKSRFSLQTLPAADFPQMAPFTELNQQLRIPQALLKTAIHQIQFAMAMQDIRYYLNGMLFSIQDNQLHLVATDGHRLAHTALTLPLTVSNQDIVLPRKTVLELAKSLKDDDSEVLLELAPNQVKFRFSEQQTLVSKVIDGKYPDYTRVIPQHHDKHLVLERQPLLRALLRAEILASEKFRGVRLLLENGRLIISCTNSEQEEAQEELDIEYQGTTLDIGFNIKYLLDMLTNVNSETLQISFGEAGHSALFTLPTNAAFKYVVMPMRI